MLCTDRKVVQEKELNTTNFRTMSSIYKESKNESKAQNNYKITEKHKKKEK